LADYTTTNAIVEAIQVVESPQGRTDVIAFCGPGLFKENVIILAAQPDFQVQVSFDQANLTQSTFYTATKSGDQVDVNQPPTGNDTPFESFTFAAPDYIIKNTGTGIYDSVSEEEFLATYTVI
jgi:hypothetical protein